MKIDKFYICGVEMCSTDLNGLYAFISNYYFTDNSKLYPICISATSAHGIIEAKKDKNFRKLLNNYFINFPDGMPLVWSALVMGHNKTRRCYGPDIFLKVITATNCFPLGHYFFGGKSGVSEELKKVALKKYGNPNIVGTYTPPFSDISNYDWEDICNRIEMSGAFFVWIGLSTPKQEWAAYELSKRLKFVFIITIGAAFDFHTGRLAQAPKWLQSCGLEWFYRLNKEPRRLFRRYIEVVPKFAFLASVDIIKYYLGKITRYA